MAAGRLRFFLPVTSAALAALNAQPTPEGGPRLADTVEKMAWGLFADLQSHEAVKVPGFLKGFPAEVVQNRPYPPRNVFERLVLELSNAANQNPVSGRLGEHHKYPDLLNAELTKAAKAAYPHVDWGKVGVAFSTGSSQWIHIVFALHAKREMQVVPSNWFNPMGFSLSMERPRPKVVMSKQSYPAYENQARLHGLKVQQVDNTPAHGHDLKGLLHAVDHQTTLVVIDNPLNPTGTYLTVSELREFFQALKNKHGDRVGVLLDEAYIEFAELDLPENERNQSLKLIEEFPNLVVLRTASKFYGLASERCGCAMANPQMLEILNKFNPAFSVTAQAQVLFAEALRNYKLYYENAVWVHKNLRHFKEELLKTELLSADNIGPIHASFVLLGLPEHIPLAKLMNELNAHQPPIAVRIVSGNQLRVTGVSNAEEMKELTAGFAKALKRVGLPVAGKVNAGLGVADAANQPNAL